MAERFSLGSPLVVVLRCLGADSNGFASFSSQVWITAGTGCGRSAGKT
jgi:hypothetical protein